MAELDDKVIVTKSKITDIADALREEMSESNEYSLPTMVEKVHELGQGQGSVYTAGVGIDITNRVVSVVDTLMIRGSASGSVASIVDGADDIPLKSCMVAIEPVQSGSGDPSPSNVRPITGWTECNMTRDGENLWDEVWEVGLISSSTGENASGNNNIRTKNHCSCKPNTTIYAQIPSPHEIRMYWYDKDKNFISSPSAMQRGVYTTPSNCYYFRFVVYDSGYGTTYNNDISINYPSTDTSYHAYKGDVYNIQLPSEAGTVYGGTLDVTNGVLTVTDGYIASYNGETLPSTWISSMDVYAEGTTPTTGAEVVYKLATPQTYNVTPTEIKTLLEINNIFADCGDVDVEYVRDATSIINWLISQINLGA